MGEKETCVHGTPSSAVCYACLPISSRLAEAPVDNGTNDLQVETQSLFKILSDQEVELQAAKRADYTGDGRMLANYEEAARATGLKTWQVMLSRIYEKLYRYRMLREGPPAQVTTETLTDTLLDVSILAKLLIVEKGGDNGE